MESVILPAYLSRFPVLFPINLIGEFANPDLHLAPSVCKHAVRRHHHGAVVRHAADFRKDRYSGGASCLLRPVFRLHPDVCILYVDYDICEPADGNRIEQYKEDL